MSAVLLSRNGAIARIVLNRPESRNAINPALAQELAAAVQDVAANGSVRCVVLSAAACVTLGPG